MYLGGTYDGEISVSEQDCAGGGCSNDPALVTDLRNGTLYWSQAGTWGNWAGVWGRGAVMGGRGQTEQGRGGRGIWTKKNDFDLLLHCISSPVGPSASV